MMQFRILSVAAAFAVALALPAAAQQPAAAPAGYKIGYVSTERVMRESRTSQSLIKSLEAEFAKREREINAGPKADIARRKALMLEEMNAKREDALRQFIDKTNGIIRRVAEAEKFDAVFFEAAYASKSIDITDKVVKAVDAAR